MTAAFAEYELLPPFRTYASYSISAAPLLAGAETETYPRLLLVELNHISDTDGALGTSAGTVTDADASEGSDEPAEFSAVTVNV